jgi:ribonuclease HI
MEVERLSPQRSRRSYRFSQKCFAKVPIHCVMQNITIYAHATRAGNRVHYGCLLVTNHRTWTERKSVLGTSANRTILQAAIDVVQKLSKKHQIKFFSTSQYLIQGMTEYIQGWKQRGWLNGPASPLKNNDLWKQLDQLTEKHHISWLYPRNSDEQRQMEKATNQAYAPSQKAMQQQWCVFR